VRSMNHSTPRAVGWAKRSRLPVRICMDVGLVLTSKRIFRRRVEDVWRARVVRRHQMGPRGHPFSTRIGSEGANLSASCAHLPKTHALSQQASDRLQHTPMFSLPPNGPGFQRLTGRADVPASRRRLRRATRDERSVRVSKLGDASKVHRQVYQSAASEDSQFAGRCPIDARIGRAGLPAVSPYFCYALITGG